MALVQSIDENLLLIISNYLTHPIVDWLMIIFTWLGNNGVIWLTLGIILLQTKTHRQTGVMLLTALLLGWLLGNAILKPWVARIRPFYLHPDWILLIPAPTGFSFPSGHTLSSFAAASVLGLSQRNWAVPAFTLALFISLSRIYLLVHYPTDILAGMILGLGIGWSSVKLIRHYSQRIKER